MMALGGGHYEGEEQNVDQSTHVGVLQEESDSNGEMTDGYCTSVLRNLIWETNQDFSWPFILL